MYINRAQTTLNRVWQLEYVGRALRSARILHLAWHYTRLAYPGELMETAGPNAVLKAFGTHQTTCADALLRAIL
jgi:hypothetical protein